MEKKWEEMSAKEKREARFKTWLSAEGVKFQNPEAENTYKKAIMRFKDAVLLEKTPDRVPVFPLGTFFQAYLYGVTPHECMYDYGKLLSASRRFLQDYKPDFYGSPAFIGSGKILDILDYKLYHWPGHGVPKNSIYQYVEGEYMKAEEYPALIDDPTDFWMRTYLPRVFGAWEPLTHLTPFPNLWEVVGVSGWMIPFGIPPVQNALKALMEAGNEAMAWIQQIMGFEMEARGMGFPTAIGGAAKAPFDILADTMRGTRAIMVRHVQTAGDARKGIREDHSFVHQAGSGDGDVLGKSSGIYSPAQGCRRIHVRRAVQEILLAYPEGAHSRTGRRRMCSLFVLRGKLQHPA